MKRKLNYLSTPKNKNFRFSPNLFVSFLLCTLLILCIVFVFVETSGVNNKVNALKQCLNDGSCVFGNISVGTLNVAEKLSSNIVLKNETVCENVMDDSCIPIRIATINGIGPNSTTLDFGLHSGSNIMLTSIAHGLTISTTNSISIDSITIDETTMLGINTSCVMPLDESCYDISGQQCMSPLMGSCFPSEIVFDTLVVQNLTVLGTQNGQMVNGNETDLSVGSLISNQTTFNGPVMCNMGGSISNDCLMLGGYVCANGPLTDSCIPASLPFVNLTVTNSLSVNNIMCSGGPIDSSCIPTLISTINSVSPDSMSNFAISDSSSIALTPITNGLSPELKPTGVTAGTFGSATRIPVITVNSEGRITDATDVVLQPPLASITIRDEGTTLSTTVNTINFVGAGVSVIDTTGGVATVSITVADAPPTTYYHVQFGVNPLSTTNVNNGGNVPFTRLLLNDGYASLASRWNGYQFNAPRSGTYAIGVKFNSYSGNVRIHSTVTNSPWEASTRQSVVVPGGGTIGSFSFTHYFGSGEVMTFTHNGGGVWNYTGDPENNYIDITSLF